MPSLEEDFTLYVSSNVVVVVATAAAAAAAAVDDDGMVPSSHMCVCVV